MSQAGVGFHGEGSWEIAANVTETSLRAGGGCD